MNSMTRWDSLKNWDPFKEMNDLHNRLSSLMNVAPFRRSDERQETVGLPQWAPLVDIAEDDKEYLIKAELPEVQKEDVSVTVNNGVVQIAGERRTEKEEKNRRFHRIERSYGRFERNFTLPEDSDGTKISAEFRDGILRVHLPKDEKAKPKLVEVKVN